MKELRNKLLEIELQIKLAKLERNEQKISQLLEEKDKIIITGGYPFKEVKHTNFMKIEEV